MSHGVYKVTGDRAYRGHPPGSVFAASLLPGIEHRLIERGAITLLRRYTPGLPERFTLPKGWVK